MAEAEIVKLLGGSGPWAVAFAYAFQLIVRAWMEDRKRLDTVVEHSHRTMADMNQTLGGLKQSIDHLTARLDEMEERHSRSEAGIR
jgi:hypothetical protein